MKTKYVRVSDKAKEELAATIIEGNKLIFPTQLTKYPEIKKLFPILGIAWHKKDKVHYIEEDSAVKIKDFLGGGQIVDEKKTRQAFYTPSELAERVVKMAEIGGNDVVLEPSCGDGALVKEIIKYSPSVHIIEIDEQVFTNTIRNYNVVGWNVDFLSFDSEDGYDKIVMNPPFDHSTWVKHLKHANSLLKKNGKLVAICPDNESNKEFQKFLVCDTFKEYEITKIEAGTFKESGTNIPTMIVEIWK